MKKKLSTIALAVIAAFGISAAAQAPAKCDKKGDCGKATCEQPCKQDCKKDCAKDSAGDKLFEGITLTPEQKTKIEALKAERKNKMENLGQATKEARKQAAKEMRDQRVNGKKEYIAKMKQILTPEQYVTFLENMALSQPAGRPDRAIGHKAPRQADKMRSGNHKALKGQPGARVPKAPKAGDKK